MHGLHLTADLYQCCGQPHYMLDADAIAALCREHTRRAGLTLVDDRWVKFPAWQGQPGGVTGTVLLAAAWLDWENPPVFVLSFALVSALEPLPSPKNDE